MDDTNRERDTDQAADQGLHEKSSPERAADLVGAIARRAGRTASDVADDVGRRVRPVVSTIGAAWSTTFGQTRSAVGRAGETVVDSSREVAGQAGAQTRRSTGAASRAGTALLDDAVRAVDAEPGGPPAALELRTKAELYEMAQERDIPGRSQMSKDELVAALRLTS
jgi:hypothetical protein